MRPKDQLKPAKFKNIMQWIQPMVLIVYTPFLLLGVWGALNLQPILKKVGGGGEGLGRTSPFRGGDFFQGGGGAGLQFSHKK